MKLWDRIEKMSDEQLKEVWRDLSEQVWCGSDMYDENTSMDEWAIMLAEEMDVRGLNKFE